MLNLRKTLQDLFDRPLKPPPEHGLRRETAAVSRRDFSLDNVKRVAQNVPFEQVKVRKQPPAPAYPQAAKEAGVQGVVAIEITVGPDGRPTLVEALSGPPALYSTALRYALGWEFEPALLKGAPQAVRFQLTMPFRLR